MQLTNLKEAKGDSSNLRMILYGAAGCGKTYSLRGFPKPMLVFDFDHKLKPLYGEEGINAVVYSSNTPEEAGRCWETFLKDLREAKKDTTIRTLAFDSLSSMDVAMLIHCVVKSGKPANSKPTLPVYGEQAENYKWFFTEINNIKDKNVIVLGHDLEARDDSEEGSGALLQISPLITGSKIKPRLPSLFEEVYYLQRKVAEGVDETVVHYKPYKKAIATSLILSGNGNFVVKKGETLYQKLREEEKKYAKV